MNRIPDKYIAIGFFFILLTVYLCTNNSTIEKMLWGAFALVTQAIGDGLRRISDSFKRKYDSPGTEKDRAAPTSS